MTEIKELNEVSKDVVGSSFSNIVKAITFKDKEYIYTLELVTKNNIGYLPGTVLVFDTLQKVVVISRKDVNKVIVKTIKPLTEVKQPKTVMHVLPINFSYN